ncbi:hypothetical protein MKC74_06690 [[Clostridium] innocuum]|nr:hypothetical protein [[Clostridium] innocuum]
MKFSDGTDMQNEDIIACYPRRIEKSKDYEVWQFPYVKNSILYEDCLAVIRFRYKTSYIFVISEKKEYLQDKDFLNRIISLVHDISNKFFLETCHVDSLYSEKTDKLILNIKYKKI